MRQAKRLSQRKGWPIHSLLRRKCRQQKPVASCYKLSQTWTDSLVRYKVANLRQQDSDGIDLLGMPLEARVPRAAGVLDLLPSFNRPKDRLDLKKTPESMGSESWLKGQAPDASCS